MRFKNLALAAPLFASFCSLCAWSSSARAQETLGSVGAASGMSSTLNSGSGAAMGRMRNNARQMSGPGAETGESGAPSFPNAGAPGQTTTTTETTVTRTVTPLAAGRRSGSAILGQLLAPPFRPIPERQDRSARGQATYARRVAQLSPKGRKRLVLNKYRIAPRGYLASYLLADRYKFAKAWKYVSTETDRFYYRPQDMARHGFNRNRVIGFRTWQDAMLAGYRPDPISRPEPGGQIASLAAVTRDEPLVRYVEYVYAGQVSPAAFETTFSYIRQVVSVINRTPRVQKYRRSTVNSILEAALTGDSSLIPRQLGGPRRVQVTQVTTETESIPAPTP